MRLPDHLIPSRAVLMGRDEVLSIYNRRARAGYIYDEMRAGELVFLPLPDNEHQRIQFLLSHALGAVTPHGDVLPGGNVSSHRGKEWLTDYRCPDILVCLPGGRAVSRNTHWEGGPDFLVEIDSPGDDPAEKLPFYASIGTREILLVRRKPHALELFQLRDGTLEPAGRSGLAAPAVLSSCTLPLTFQLVPGSERPQMLVAHPADGRTWLV